MIMSRKAGAKVAWICCLIILLFASFPTASHANEGRSAYDAIVNGGGSGNPATIGGAGQNAAIPGSSSTGVWGYLLQVVFSLGVIVVCIYLLLRFLGKRQLSTNNSGPIKVIGTASLGNGKTLQIVMIGESLYVLGVGDNVQLLRHLPAGDEADLVLADAEIKPASGVKWDWLSFLNKRKSQEELFFPAEQKGGSFEELLNKQWGEVNGQSGKSAAWQDEDGQRRGDHR